MRYSLLIPLTISLSLVRLAISGDQWDCVRFYLRYSWFVFDVLEIYQPARRI